MVNQFFSMDEADAILSLPTDKHIAYANADKLTAGNANIRSVVPRHYRKTEDTNILVNS